jgi:hypothetical protein
MVLLMLLMLMPAADGLSLPPSVLFSLDLEPLQASSTTTSATLVPPSFHPSIPSAAGLRLPSVPSPSVLHSCSGVFPCLPSPASSSPRLLPSLVRYSLNSPPRDHPDRAGLGKQRARRDSSRAPAWGPC